MSSSPEPSRSAPIRFLVAFGRFWWEFLVGETPELLLGAVAAVGLVALLAHDHSSRVVTVGALPVLVLLLLSVSAGWAVRRRSRHEPGRD